MRHFVIIARLAAADWWHERMLSLCAVLALAGMLTPLLVLYGVRAGLVENLRAALLRDPTSLIIIPTGSGSGGFTGEFLENLKQRPDVRFVIARTRDVAAEMQFSAKDGSYIPLTLEPTGSGDPLPERFGLALLSTAPQNSGTDISGPEDTLLSASAAQKLSVTEGDILHGRLGRRRPDGVLETTIFTARVAGVLPPQAISSDTAFFPLATLENIQDYRDYIAVPAKNWSGDAAAAAPRHYESFRLYARELDDVEKLDGYLRDLHINVTTKAKNIADIRMIDDSLSRLLLVIALAIGLGFSAFTLSSSLAAVRRKNQILGMLRLLGVARTPLLCYPLYQVLFTCLLGTLMAWFAACGVAVGVDAVFAAHSAVGDVCDVKFSHLIAAFAAGFALAPAAALYPAIKAANVEPALVVRDM